MYPSPRQQCLYLDNNNNNVHLSCADQRLSAHMTHINHPPPRKRKGEGGKRGGGGRKETNTHTLARTHTHTHTHTHTLARTHAHTRTYTLIHTDNNNTNKNKNKKIKTFRRNTNEMELKQLQLMDARRLFLQTRENHRFVLILTSTPYVSSWSRINCPLLVVFSSKYTSRRPELNCKQADK